MRISRSQQSILQAPQRLDFEQRLEAHLRSQFPRRVRALERRGGAGAVGDFLEAAVADAREHGFRSERHLCRFVNLSAVFGDGWARHGVPGWAEPALRSRAANEARMARLYAAGIRNARKPQP